MADDIAARITIAIENADAVKRCEEIEERLRKVSAAREDDLSLAKQAAKQAEQSASAEQQEIAAQEKQISTRKNNNKEIQQQIQLVKELGTATERVRANTTLKVNTHEEGISVEEARRLAGLPPISPEEAQRMREEHLRKVEDFNRKMDAAIARQEAKKKTTEQNTGQRETAEDLQARNAEAERIFIQRAENEKKAQDAIKQRAEMSRKELQLETLETKKLLAQQRLLLAVQKQQEIQTRISLVKNSLNTAKNTGNKPGELGATIKLEQLQKELLQADQAVNQATEGLQAAEKGLENINDTTGKTSKTARVFAQALRGVGSAMGVSVPTNTAGLSGADKTLATLGAGGFAAAAVARLVDGLMDLSNEAFEAERQRLLDNNAARSEITAKLHEEIAERHTTIEALRNFNNSANHSAEEIFTLSHKFGQLAETLSQTDDKIKKLNLTPDPRTGRIVNADTLSAQAELADLKKILDDAAAARTQAANTQSALQQQSDDFTAKSRSLTPTLARRIFGENEFSLFAERFNLWGKGELSESIKTLEALVKANENYAKANESYFKAKKKYTEAENQFNAKLSAILTDRQKEINKQQQQYKEEAKAIAERRKINVHGRGEVESARFAEASQAKADLSLQIRKQEQRVRKAYSIYQKQPGGLQKSRAREVYINEQHALQRLKDEELKQDKKLLEYENTRANIAKRINDAQKEFDYSKGMKEAKTLEERRAVYVKHLKQEQKRLQTEEGYTRREAEAMTDIMLKRFDYEENQKEKKRITAEREERFAQLYKMQAPQLRDTSQNAVLANSVEALRLQSRMLTNANPQQKLLSINQRQYQVQQEIARNTRRNGNTSFEVVNV